MYFLSAWDTFKNPFVDLWNKILDLGPKWIGAIVVMIAAYLLSKLVKYLIQKTISKTSTAGHVDILIARGGAALVLILGFILAIGILGMSLTGAMAALGLASVGVGFALQDILSNLFAGVILLVQHPFTIGDQVEIGGQEGVVENVRVRDTQILTYEGERVYIPNKSVFSDPIINYTSTPQLRIDIPITIRYEDDIAKAKRLAMEIMRSTRGVLRHPEPEVMVDSAGESGIDLILRFWMGSDRNRRLQVRSGLLQWVKAAFDSEGIQFAYPVRSLTLREKPDDTSQSDSGETQIFPRIPDE